ncbi:MAG: biopolymer transporter ExbD [Gemmatimonadaceae bacterium]
MTTQSGAARGRQSLNNEINVTPMIDVLLVLLIIFMAAVPSRRLTIDAQLPDPRPVLSSGAPSIVLELDASGAYAINTAPVAHGDLAARLRSIYDGRPDKVLFVKGDGRVSYAAVIDAMDVARGAGVKVLGLP